MISVANAKVKKHSAKNTNIKTITRQTVVLNRGETKLSVISETKQVEIPVEKIKDVVEENPSLNLLFTNEVTSTPIINAIVEAVAPPKVEKVVIVPIAEGYSLSDLSKFSNDKEVLISSFDNDEKLRIQNKFLSKDENVRIQKVFNGNLLSFLNNKDAHCEARYIDQLLMDLAKNKIATSLDEVVDVFKMLRVNNIIDDVFYDILENLTKDHFAFLGIDLNRNPIRNIFKDYELKSKDYDLKVLFSSFKNYPDEVNSCSYIELIKMRDSVGIEKDSIVTKSKILKDLAFSALSKDIISLETYNKIKFLGIDSTLSKRNVWLNDYIKIIFNAKNKMIPFKRTYNVINLEDESSFSSERLKRFSQITRRKILYQKYDENQIILLSQAMKKASQRMGVDPDTKTGIPYIVQEFNIVNEAGETENYVEKIELDTQSQFNLARRLLRKDIVALQMMKSFQRVKISYEDLVVASLETGYISLDDIEYVVKYDDLWNSTISKTERLMRMTFKIAGYGTFFLPPPWNVTTALALSIVEGIVDSKNINGASNDNPNTFIE